MAIRNRTFTEWVIDKYSFFSHKISWRQGSTRAFMAPGWIPSRDSRRIRAYAMLEAYYCNTARLWMAGDAPTDEIVDRREFGDVKLLVEQTLSSLLGVNQTILVDDAVAEESTATSIAGIQQESLEQWAKDELFQMKVIEGERQSIKYGDNVYVLYWDERKQRPCVSVYDPGFYFPYFDPFSTRGQEDFPDKVNICWEFEDDSNPENIRRYVRRLQWFLAPRDDMSTIQLPWNMMPTEETCWFSDGYWEMEGIGEDPSLFDERRATWVTPVTDLGIDFIPVVHVPNDVALQDHFGTSLIAHVLQLIDEIQANDTDVSRASALSGSPAIAVSGGTVNTDDEGNVRGYGPGQILELGDGSATVIDASTGLQALLDLKDALLERLSVNIRLPEALLGRVKPNEVPSGIAITLSFTPHTGMIQEMRQVRDHKYQLLFKFVCRMFWQHNVMQSALPTRYVFGSFLPADKQETMTLVVQLYTTKVISLETAVQMLIDAGFPIYSVVEEIEKIMARDYESAQQLSAMGDLNDGRNLLGLPPLSDQDIDMFMGNGTPEEQPA